MKSIFVFLIVMVTSCNSSKTTPEQTKIGFDVLLEHTTGGRVNKDIVIVSNQNALQKVYDDLNLNQKPDYNVPKINFETESVIVFFLGEKSTGGYSISVKDIIESKNNISISYRENGPKPTDMVTMVVTQPYCIVKTKRLSKEIKFIKVD